MTIDLKNIIGSSNAITHSAGDLLYNELTSKKSDTIIIDFNNIILVSSAFLNASIGKIFIKYPDFFKKISFNIPEDKQIIQKKIDKVIENASTGDFYDGLVDDASKSE
ncbi:MAG: hypothetical protein DI539_00255 [Flavobacterium psychrophilum]|nr:MAG: hypothetical protein DI539_00255 [Flavobacterium psychrophilum]